MLAAGHFISSRFSRAFSIVRVAGRSSDDMMIEPPNERPPEDAGAALGFAMKAVGTAPLRRVIKSRTYVPS